MSESSSAVHNCTCYCSSHRFEFLRPALPHNWSYKPELVEKTMVWSFEDLDVVWECHDGVVYAAPLEDRMRMGLWLAYRDSVNQNNRKWFYVKPNWSDTKCRKFADLAGLYGGKVLLCPPWSYYLGSKIDGLVKSVDVKRKLGPQRLFSFLGNESYKHDHYDRVAEIQKARKVWGNDFYVLSGMGAQGCIDCMLASDCLFQPHGVGLRHNIYEGMALGVPSVIPDSSYMHDFVRASNFVYKPDEPLPCPTREECIEMGLRCKQAYWENMRPEIIVTSVLLAAGKL